MTYREKVVGHLYDCLAASKLGNMWVFVRKDIVGDALALLKEQEPMTPEEFERNLREMFSSIWESEIDHPVFQDTVGELMTGVLQLYKQAVKCDD